MLFRSWIDRRPKLDGGIADRAGLSGLGANERVFHHHLPSSSPWRGVYGKAGGLPAPRDGLKSLIVEGLPRVTPGHLERGRAAFAAAQRATRTALKRPVSPLSVLSV